PPTGAAQPAQGLTDTSSLAHVGAPPRPLALSGGAPAEAVEPAAPPTLPRLPASPPQPGAAPQPGRPLGSGAGHAPAGGSAAPGTRATAPLGASRPMRGLKTTRVQCQMSAVHP